MGGNLLKKQKDASIMRALITAGEDQAVKNIEKFKVE